jgi:hypothetical protein
MATRKQQRRKYMRAKEHARRPVSEDGEPKPEKTSSPKKATARGGKAPQPPSISRAVKRAALFAAGLLIFVQVLPLGGSPTPAQSLLQAGLFFIWLVPFGYMMDRFLYNRWLKQQG